MKRKKKDLICTLKLANKAMMNNFKIVNKNSKIVSIAAQKLEI